MEAPPRIFVAIPSYRDPECQHTVKDLFDKAALPDRIFVGICWQFDAERDQECFLIKTRPSQVRIREVPAAEARGPCVARHLAQQLWNGEEYHLAIDSHMRFVQNWDALLIDLLATCPSEKPIITTYPPGYELPNRIPDQQLPTYLVAKQFGEDGFLRLNGKLLSRKHNKCLPTYFWVAGFSFSRSQIIKEVPYDPYLEFLFFGEETSMTVRLWTHGWDFFVPGVNVVYHLWTRSYRPTFRELPDRSAREAKAQQRVRVMFGTSSSAKEEEMEKYGLGAVRTLAEYCTASGVNFHTCSLAPQALTGGLKPNDFFESRVTDAWMLVQQHMTHGAKS